MRHLAAVPLLAALLAAPNAPPFPGGVVVTRVAKGAEAERAGLKENDVLLSWERGGERGQLESPFELTWVETEQAPRGPVTLRGRRGPESRSWELREGWSLQARPALPPALEGALARAGKDPAAVRALPRPPQAPPWLDQWLAYQEARLLAAAQRWREADDRYDAVVRGTTQPHALLELLVEWGETFRDRSDAAAGERYARAALAGRQAWGGETLAAASILRKVAWVLSNHGDGDPARPEKHYQEGLAIRQKLAPGSLAVANSYNNLAALWEDRDPPRAEAYHHRAIAIKERLVPDSVELAWSFNNLAVVLETEGEVTKADDAYVRALAIMERRLPDSLDVATLLHNAAMTAFDRGDLVTAEKRERRGLELQQKQGGSERMLAEGWHGLGRVAEARGDLDAAERHYGRALAIREKVAPESFLLSLTLTNLATVARRRGNLDHADALASRALAIKRKRQPGTVYVGTSLVELALVAEARGDWARAESCYREALAIDRKIAPAGAPGANVMAALAKVREKQGDRAGAEKLYRQSIAILARAAPESSDHAEALAGLGALARRQGQPKMAVALLSRALAALEKQIGRLGGNGDVRARFRAERAGYYRDYLDLLIERGEPALAFQVLERWRAQSLLEMLTAGQIQVTGVDPALLARERSLQVAINAKTDLRLHLSAEKPDPRRLAALNRELAGLLADYAQAEEQIRVASPAYAALTQPRALTAGEVQKRLLGPDTLLLSYALGDERSHLWALTATSLAVHRLPGRATLEPAARRLHKLLTARNREVAGETAEQRRARLAAATGQLPEAAAALSRLVLAPVGPALAGRRLVIVADGVLQYIPFSVLPTPGETRPLVADHELAYLPSASVLAALREQRARRQPPARSVAVLADPVFSRADERVRTPGAAITAAEDPTWSAERRLTRSAGDVGLAPGAPLARLRFTRREADAILTLAPGGRRALDFDASRATATSGELAQYRVVHFATHGLLDGEHPELSGLVLSLVDEKGRPQGGFLDLQDIYNLRLPAELVVLSGCSTALGKTIDGEGIIGLTRGFMYAGASRVLASLWRVDDLATAELMERFYRGMLEGGLGPVAALRRAQTEMAKHRDWHDPYYWAAFTLQGDW